jgi:hypothetical protein
MRHLDLGIALCLLGLGSCAGHLGPSAMRDTHVSSAPLTGVWEGVITGRELATASHIDEQEATLRVNADGTWTMHYSGAIAGGRVVDRRADDISLEGRLCTDGVGKRVRYRLQFAGERFVAGSAHAYYAGRRVDTGLVLGTRSVEGQIDADSPARRASAQLPRSCHSQS